MDGTDGCADWSTSPGFLGCGSVFGVFPSIFVLYLSYLPSEALSLISTLQISSL